jgi:ABC-type antimicrobial peptide transport system permease subunit
VYGFASLALVLAAIGLHGVLSCGVAARVREIGVRSAIGASRRHIVALIVREGMQAVGVGLLVGLVSSALTARLLEGSLFGILPLDPVSFLLAPVALGVVAIVASALPAWRAARVDPVRALRVD